MSVARRFVVRADIRDRNSTSSPPFHGRASCLHGFTIFAALFGKKWQS
jgi:hypothetical protein